MKWPCAVLLAMLVGSGVIGIHSRQLRADTSAQDADGIYTSAANSGRALTQAVSDSLVGPISGANCLYTASSNPPAQQCLVSQNQGFKLCLQPGGL